MVKNTQKMIESSNSTTMFRNIYRERFPIRRGKIIQWSTKNLKTKSSNLIFSIFKRRQNFVLKNTQKMVESSNSTTKFRNIYREGLQIRRGKRLQWSIGQKTT